MEKAYDVYITKDYEIFKRLVGNRPVAEDRISKIAQSIKEIGWVRNPIVVNENMEVVDGQGRLTALERLGLPVEYIIAKGAGTKECIRMNMNMINWKLPDFIRSYAEQGNVNYQRLLELLENYAGGNLNIITTAVYRVSKSKHREIKDGSLQLTAEQFENAKKSLDYIQPILEELDLKRLPGSYIRLMQTLIYYFGYDEVDKKRLKEKVLKYMYSARPWVTNPDCEREVEDAYNYHALYSDKQSIAYLVKEERMRRRAELNAEAGENAKKRVRKGIQGFLTDEQLEQIGGVKNESMDAHN